ncbi:MULTISPECIES: acyl-CoA synthetase [Micrococcaceae]|uniref:acyl-CoA synthetase n=1 Tax=Micrococcaceae TaxID=1268 RepID=UPI00105B68B3|nr:long-chain fatty acid--CoA ligase [Arthrobacter sp. JUb115]TDU24593.1 fatty-acyl-CoA synthase [Arthrobacter sp. JUb115]
MLNKGFGNWIHRRRMKSAQQVAVIHAGVGLSYAQLAERIDKLSSALAASGVARGSRVAFLGANHAAYLETMFAVTQLGALFVPLNVRLAPRELNFALRDSGSEVLIYVENFASEAHASIEGSPVSTAWEVASVPCADSSYERALQAGRSGHDDIAVELEDPAIILYTSGTTGTPKGAVLTHANMTWNSYNVIVDYDVTSRSVVLLIAPLFHVAALGMGALPMLLKGGTVVLQERFDPAAVLDAVERYQVTQLSGVPTTFQLLAEHEKWEETDLSSLEMLTCGGSAVPLRVLEAYEARGLGFSGGYGLTETAPGATMLQAMYSRPKMGSAGLPHFFTDIRIADSLGNEVPAGEVGEILISGPNVIKEYWGRPEATSGAFHESGWFRSGDIGHVDEEGFLFISDRLKDMIISGGENIYPAEVEQAIMGLPEIESVAVIGVPDEKWGEVPRAVIVLKSGRSLGEEDVVAYLDGRLARYKIPRTSVFLDELPRTASGKIRKADLRKQFS